MAQIVSIDRLIQALSAENRAPISPAVWLEEGRLVIGRYPTADSVFDFATETFVGGTSVAAPPTNPAVEFPLPSGGRRTGSYIFGLRGQVYPFSNLKQLLKGVLLILDAEDPTMLERLSDHKPRSKRVVARKPELLYDDQDMPAKFADPLKPGWFYATNNSAVEVRRYVALAAELSGLSAEEFQLQT